MNSMSTFIKTGKDKIKKEDLSNVVYKVNCQDCNYSYVGQTKRKLKTRLKKHILKILINQLPPYQLSLIIN